MAKQGDRVVVRLSDGTDHVGTVRMAIGGEPAIVDAPTAPRGAQVVGSGAVRPS